MAIFHLKITPIRRRAAQARMEMRSKGGVEKEDTQALARQQRSKDMEYEP